MAFDGRYEHNGRDATLGSLVADAQRIDADLARLHAERATMLAAAFDLADRESRQKRASSRDCELALRDITAEIATAIRVSDRSLQHQLSDAWILVNRFSGTHAALTAGTISAAHARIITDLGANITDAEARTEYERDALVIAERETAGRLRALIAPLAEEARTESIDERHQTARIDRRVEVRDLSDGMSELCATLPSILAHGIADRLTRMAREVKNQPVRAGVPSAGNSGAGAGAVADSNPETPDTRTQAQVAADVFADILLGGAPVASGDALSAISGRVQVTVPLPTLAGVTDAGAELAGVGPIDAESVRELAGLAPGWDRVMTDPVTGLILAVDRYRPSAEQRRALRVRDEHCRFPGCRRPALQCDLDHTEAASEGGATDVRNLAHLCRRHHTLKGETRWKVENLGGGILKWISPIGREYIDAPPRSVRFSDPSDARYPSGPSGPSDAGYSSGPSDPSDPSDPGDPGDPGDAGGPENSSAPTRRSEPAPF